MAGQRGRKSGPGGNGEELSLHGEGSHRLALGKLGPNRFSFPAKALLQQIPEKAFGAAAANRAGSRNIEQ